MEAAVNSCAEAYKSWSKTTPMARQQIMFKFQHLIKENLKEIAKNITYEQGKTLPDAEGDVMRGLQVVEHACSLTFMQLGTNLPGIAKDMDCMSMRVPLGVTAGICPFNFPAMIPLWVSYYNCIKIKDLFVEILKTKYLDVSNGSGLW